MPLLPNKKPLFTATKNLDVEYCFINSEQGDMGSVLLNGNDIHMDLTMGCTQALHLRNSIKSKSGQRFYTQSLDQVNFATMGITILYSDTDTNEGYLGDDILSHYMDVQSPFLNQRVVSTMDFYSNVYQVPNVPANKSKRCHLYNQSLVNRITAFEKISNDYHHGTAITTKEKARQAVLSPTFHEIYHHTEQTGLFYIETNDYINLLLLELEKIDAALFYGFVIDIHTQRMMCSNCNLSLLGIQETTSNGFLKKFNQALLKHDIEINPLGTAISARISAESACKGQTLEAFKLVDDEELIHPHIVCPQLETEVLQKHIPKRLPTVQLAGQSIYTGAFFASSQSTKSKWEAAIEACPYLKC